MTLLYRTLPRDANIILTNIFQLSSVTLFFQTNANILFKDSKNISVRGRSISLFHWWPVWLFCLCYSISSEFVFPRTMVACFELYSDLFTCAIVQIIFCIVMNGESENGISIEDRFKHRKCQFFIQFLRLRCHTWVFEVYILKQNTTHVLVR